MSAYITENQNALKVSLDSGIDLTGTSEVAIKYQKPDGTNDKWPGQQSGTLIEVAFDSSSEAFDQAGLWTIWTYAKFSDGTEADGRPIEVHIYEKGEIPE